MNSKIDSSKEQEWQNPLLESSKKEASAGRQALSEEVTSLYGTICKKQPAPNELPVLKAGKFSTGCEYESFDKTSTTRANFENATEASAHIFSRAGEWTSAYAIGSGFAVAKSKDSCFVITDNHVVSDSDGDFDIKMSDGVKYNAQLQSVRPDVDLAIIKVDIGSSNSELCKPVRLPEKTDEFAKKGDLLSIIGHPAQAKNLYVSNGENLSLIKRSDYRDGDGDELKLLPGEDPERKVFLIDAHVEGGNSGSSVYNAQKEVGAVLDAGDSNKQRSAIATPITKKLIDEMLGGVEIEKN